MTAETLEEAIAIQNEIEYGLTAGLHSLDSAEMGVWLDTIQAGNLYVNRGITGAIVQRQPFGGWKKSAVGAGTKAGGPNYLIGLGSWLPAEAKAKRGTMLQGAAAQILAAAKSVDVSAEELQTLQQSLFSDAAAWEAEFGTRKDVSACPQSATSSATAPSLSPSASPKASGSLSCSAWWQPAQWRVRLSR